MSKKEDAKKDEKILITPCWRSMVPLNLLVIESGTTAEARQTGRDELFRCATAADQWNEHAEKLIELLDRAAGKLEDQAESNLRDQLAVEIRKAIAPWRA